MDNNDFEEINEYGQESQQPSSGAQGQAFNLNMPKPSFNLNLGGAIAQEA